MTIWRLRIAYWTRKATNTYSENVIVIAFSLQQWLHECTLMLRHTYSTLQPVLCTNLAELTAGTCSFGWSDNLRGRVRGRVESCRQD